MYPDDYNPAQVAPSLFFKCEKITYNWPEAASKWVASEVAAGRLRDIPRTTDEIHALFTTENVLKHMEIANSQERRVSLPGL